MLNPKTEVRDELLRVALIMKEMDERILNPAEEEIAARTRRFCIAADQVCPDRREFSRRVFVTQGIISK